MLQAHPEGAAVKTEDGDLPLHLAILKTSPLKVVGRLLEPHPKGSDREGRVWKPALARGAKEKGPRAGGGEALGGPPQRSNRE